MPTAQEIADAIAAAKLNAVQNPLREEFAGRVILERSADDLIKLEQSLASDISASIPGFGIRCTKLVPGACG